MDAFNLKFRQKGKVIERKCENSILDLHTVEASDKLRGFYFYVTKNQIDLTHVPVVWIHHRGRSHGLLGRVTNFLNENPNFRGAILATYEWRNGWGECLIAKWETINPREEIPQEVLDSRKALVEKKIREKEEAEKAAREKALWEEAWKIRCERIARVEPILKEAKLPQGCYASEIRISNVKELEGTCLLVFQWKNRAGDTKMVHADAELANLETAARHIVKFLLTDPKISLFVSLDKEGELKT